MDSDSSKTLYKPGQVVPKAGIYKVLHAEHRSPHRATFKAGDRFPPCSTCEAGVRFELMFAAEEKDGAGN
ncbi:MAG TPA: YjzC family protein [Candidatus Angelobacter sp.]|nr:YjzC family protein [Candidatus Angelobacter sp.]